MPNGDTDMGQQLVDLTVVYGRHVLLDFGDNTELLHLAESTTAAELWIAREGYRNARLEIVGDKDGDRAGGADLAA